MDVLALC